MKPAGCPVASARMAARRVATVDLPFVPVSRSRAPRPKALPPVENQLTARSQAMDADVPLLDVHPLAVVPAAHNPWLAAATTPAPQQLSSLSVNAGDPEQPKSVTK